MCDVDTWLCVALDLMVTLGEEDFMIKQKVLILPKEITVKGDLQLWQAKLTGVSVIYYYIINQLKIQKLKTTTNIQQPRRFLPVSLNFGIAQPHSSDSGVQ